MPRVVMYSTSVCSYCSNARQLLRAKGVAWDEIRVDARPELLAEMVERSGQRTVPQVWIGEKHVGGFAELYALNRVGALDALLNAG